MITLFLLVIIALALVGMPLFLVIAGATFLLLWGAAEPNYWEVIIKVIDINTKPELTTIPLFTFAGFLMAESGTPRRLVRLANAVFGWMPGGLAIVSLVVCALFTAFTGASGVTIIAIGSLLLPSLIKEKYPSHFSLGLVTATSNVGMLFPPSLPIIVYGIVSGAAIDHLFLAGVLPGLLLIVLLASYSTFIGHTSAAETHKFDIKEVWAAIKGAAWEIPLPIVILGGIYGGFFAPLQAAAVTAAYAFVIEVFIYRDIHPTKHLPKIMRESMVLIGGILVILAAAGGFTDYLITQQVPDKIFAALKPYIGSKIAFLMVINVFLLVVGCMMDIFSAIFVVVPLIIPFANQYGVDPVHLGIIFLTNLGIGYSTPPVGMNLFIAAFAFKERMVTLYRASIPFLVIMLISLLVITYVPALTMYPLELFGFIEPSRDSEKSEVIEPLQGKVEDAPTTEDGDDALPSLEDMIQEKKPVEEGEEDDLPSLEDMVQEKKDEDAKEKEKEDDLPSLEDMVQAEEEESKQIEDDNLPSLEDMVKEIEPPKQE